MCEVNQTRVTQIHLLGFQGLYKFKPLFFVGFVLCYMVILVGNLLIITLVTTVDHLKIPMFFFLKHLAIADALLTTTVIPLMLDIILTEKGTLSFTGCIFQIYCSFIFGSVQCFLIPIMSYDRYLAICAPLHYASLMTLHVCLHLVIGSWCLSTLLITSEIIVVSLFNFCGLNFVDHFFCDLGPVLHLATSDTSNFLIYDFILSIFTVLLPLVFIFITYILIFFTILKISSAYGRRKAFSTCSSHLVTVCSYYGTLITMYMMPTDYSTSGNVNKYRSLLCIVVTPLMNPVVYSLRNQEIKRSFLKCFMNSKTVESYTG